MPRTATTPSLHNKLPPVKSNIPHPLYPRPDAVIHHKDNSYRLRIIYKNKGEPLSAPYGVSPSHRVLSPGLLLKKFDLVRDCLKYPLGLTTGQREVVLRLLRLRAYYGKVYPKESQVTELPGCSKATFWRTIRLLQELGLVRVINRYLVRPHAQISNLYQLDRLIVLLARYLAEHGVAFLEKWLAPALAMPGSLFWSQIYQTPEARAGPGVPALSGP
ncbi:hypothetical protein ES708_01543 [subsurface metagenome]